MLYKIFLFISLFSLTAANSHFEKNRLVRTHADNASSFLLEYTGGITGYMNISVGVQIAMDTSRGFRYDVTFENGSSVISHVAFFYKFSNPSQFTEYNYRTHQSHTITAGNAAKGEDLSVIGKENIDTFICTHLQKKGANHQQDYWMSKSVPGYTQLVNILRGIDPSLAMMAINQTLFNWGGLVREQTVATEKNGQTTTSNLKLVEAQTGIVFTDKDFEVPSK